MKKLGIALIGLIVLLIAGILIAPSFIDWNAQKGRIAAEVRAQTGRELVIDGDVGLSLLPTPTLSAEQVRFANVEGAEGASMAELKSLKVRVALLPLLQGNVQVESVVLVEPVIRLQVLADGTRNWTFTRPGAPEAAEPDAGERGGGGMPGGISLDSLQIVDGTLVYEDAVAGRREMVTDLDAEIAAESLQGPLAASGEAVVRDVPLGFQLSLGRLVQDGATPLTVTMTLNDANATANFNGAISMHPDRVSLRGELKGEGTNLARLVAAVAPEADVPGLAQPFSLRSDVTADEAEAAMSDLALRLGETSLDGEVRAKLAEPADVFVRLKASRIDLDALLAETAAAADAPPSGPAATEGGTNEAAVPPDAPVTQTTAPAPEPVTLPENVTGTLEVSVDALVYRGQVVRQVLLNMVLENGRLEVGQALALLPGGSDVTLTGSLAPAPGEAEGALRFDGHIEAASDNLRAMLEWLGVNVARVPQERLRRMALSSRISAGREEITLSDVDLAVDLTRATGGVAIALRERLGLGIGLAVDKINVDAYRPRGTAAAAGDATTATGGTGAAGEAAPAAASGDEEAAAPDALADFDANLDLRIGSLTIQGVTIETLRVDGTLQKGDLLLREVSVADVAGAKGTVNGTIANVTGAPSVNLAFEASVPDPARIAKLAEVDPGPLAKVGAFSAEGSLEGTMERATVAVDLDALNGNFSVRGPVQPLSAPPSFDIVVAAKHPDLAKLLRTLAPDVSVSPQIGAIDAQAGLAGTPSKITVTNLTGTIGPATLSGGLIADMTGESAKVSDINLDVRLRHDSLAGLIRTVAPDASIGGGIGGVDLKANVAGSSEQIAVTGLSGRLGQTDVSGSVSANLAGARPAVTADLTTGVLPVSALMAPAGAGAGTGGGAAAATGGGGGGATKSGGKAAGKASARWSTEPLDLSGLRGVDANIKLQSAALLFDETRLERAVVDVGLADGVLDLRKVAGTLFGGAVQVSGKVDARETPRIGLALTAIDLNLATLLRDMTESDRVSGPLTVEASVSSQGASEAALVQALDGSGTVKGTLTVRAKAEEQIGSAVLGILGGKIKEIRGLTDTTTVLFNAFAGQPAAVAGSFAIDQGVIRTDDLTIDGRQAIALTTGTASLPAWTIDTRTEVFQGDTATGTPYLTANLTGPLDKPNPKIGGQALQRRQEPAPAPAPDASGAVPPAAEAPAQPQKPEDILKEGVKEGLKGLFQKLQ